MKTKNESTKTELLSGKKLTRKQALSRAGLIAVSAATTLMLLHDPAKGGSPTSAPAAPSTPSGGNWTKRN